MKNINNPRKPAFRKLRAYAFDPSLSLKIDTVEVNEMEYTLPWEKLEKGPIGSYIEVIDYDPTLDRYYEPVDLDEPYILVENGIRPSESNPKFHQQMVYAVAMTTIKNFEKALGRKVIWSTRLLSDPQKYEEYVHKLRIYPHALRASNAYYSPHKKAILFGYFQSRANAADIHMPDAIVFTCLSHDIIAHEVTHAILDGIFRHYNEPTNPDVLAFHEAFADIVALFQHFTFPEVLKHQIAKTRGNLENQNLLGQLAQEFGSAIGGYGSLRDAIGKVNPVTKQWEATKPNPEDYQKTMEPHHRGSILVAAIFEAFLTIYKKRVADLLRIATGGTGILPEGELHPDLVNRMAKEASKAAKHVMNMCIRALDYCPPVDITFGDYLRAIITADMDLIKNDDHEYRLAFIDAFRKRGIYPTGIKTLSIDSLKQKELDIKFNDREGSNDLVKSNIDINENTKNYLSILNGYLQEYGEEIKYITDREEIYRTTTKFIRGNYDNPTQLIEGLHQRWAITIEEPGTEALSEMTGLAFHPGFENLGIKTDDNFYFPQFSIQNLRLISRVGPDGNLLNQVVFSIFQKSGVYIQENGQVGHFVPDIDVQPNNGFIIYGGCTLLFDLDENSLKYIISKPILDVEKYTLEGHYIIDEERVRAQYRYQFDEGMEQRSLYNKYFGIGLNNNFSEPFAMLHNH
ncbi:gluzincin family metallopeptidase [Portibacter marinus]|uniref:hypothetical protein n=1 Tax=Portibacter marinus TaxID=2898660 RepID=UPI001F32F68A|nr:hypothetical protein [Portibacter marinus]